MAKINYHTDRLGGIKGHCLVELECNDGRVIMIMLIDDRLHILQIIGGPLDVLVIATNALDVYQSGKSPDPGKDQPHE